MYKRQSQIRAHIHLYMPAMVVKVLKYFINQKFSIKHIYKIYTNIQNYLQTKTINGNIFLTLLNTQTFIIIKSIHVNYKELVIMVFVKTIFKTSALGGPKIIIFSSICYTTENL